MEEIIKPFKVQEGVTEITEADGDICLYNMIVLFHRCSISLVRRVLFSGKKKKHTFSSSKLNNT